MALKEKKEESMVLSKFNNDEVFPILQSLLFPVTNGTTSFRHLR